MENQEEFKMKSFREYLVDKGLVSKDQLKTYDEEFQKTGQSLEEWLVKSEIFKNSDLANSLAEYASLPLIEKITDKMTDPTILSKTPFKFLRDNAVIPVTKNKELIIITANPINFQPLDEVNKILGGGAHYAVGIKSVIVDAINRFYPLEETHQMMEDLEEGGEKESLEFAEIDEKDILGMESDAPIIKLVNSIFFQAVKRDASDIHIEPQEKDVRVRYRVDGVMHLVLNPPKRAQSALISRIKIMSNLNIAEKRKPQDGRIQIKIADKSIDNASALRRITSVAPVSSSTLVSFASTRKERPCSVTKPIW